MTVHIIQNSHNSGESTEKLVALILGLGRIECTVPIMGGQYERSHLPSISRSNHPSQTDGARW